MKLPGLSPAGDDQMKPGSNLFGTNLCLNDQARHDPNVLLDNVRLLTDHGAHYVELAPDPAALGLLTAPTIASLWELPCRYTVHLPYASVDTSHHDADFRRASINIIRRDALTAQALQPEVYIFHPHGLKTASLLAAADSDAERQLHLNYAVNGLRETVESLLAAGLKPRSIAVENLAGVPFSAFEGIIREYDLSVCLDIGHWLRSFEDPFEFIGSWADRLAEVHIHQTFEGEPKRIDHNSLELPGLVDPTRIVEALRDVRFTGPLLLEVKGREAVVNSLEVLSGLLA